MEPFGAGVEVSRPFTASFHPPLGNDEGHGVRDVEPPDMA